jgi:hypothetical protein
VNFYPRAHVWLLVALKGHCPVSEVRRLRTSRRLNWRSTLSFLAKSLHGICVAIFNQVGREQFCDHCERRLTNKAYRVISEDAGGGILLNMIVCDPCNQKAQELGLKTREFNLDE